MYFVYFISLKHQTSKQKLISFFYRKKNKKAKHCVYKLKQKQKKWENNVLRSKILNKTYNYFYI